MKAPSDSTLNKLWRRAVLHKWQRDPISGCADWERLQCHHFIRRKHYVTRWDWRNGIPLTAKSHAFAHTGAGGRMIAAILESVGFLDDLFVLEFIMKKDYLQTRGMSDAEFRQAMKRELTRALDEPPITLTKAIMIESKTVDRIACGAHRGTFTAF